MVAAFIIHDQISWRDLLLLIYHLYLILGPNIMGSKGIVGCAASLLLAMTVSAAQITQNLSKSETLIESLCNLSKSVFDKFLGQMQRISSTGQSTSTTCAGTIPISTSGTPTMVLGPLALRRGMSRVSCIETREKIFPTPKQPLKTCEFNFFPLAW